MIALAKKPKDNHGLKRRRTGTRHPPVPVPSTEAPFLQRKPFCPCHGGCPRCGPVLQAKPMVGRPGDRYEQQADRVADQVMGMPGPRVQLTPEVTSPEAVVEGEGRRFRRERQRDLSRIISGMRFRKIRRDCPRSTRVRLLRVLARMRTRVNANPHCVRFFRRQFGITPDRLFHPHSVPTITVDPDMVRSGVCRCPEPSIRIQQALCRSRWLERVIMHELTHYAGCLTRSRRPCSEALAERGADRCIGTHSEVLEAERKRRERGGE